MRSLYPFPHYHIIPSQVLPAPAVLTVHSHRATFLLQHSQWPQRHGREANQTYHPQRSQRTTEWLHQWYRAGVPTPITFLYRQPLKGNKKNWRNSATQQSVIFTGPRPRLTAMPLWFCWLACSSVLPSMTQCTREILPRQYCILSLRAITMRDISVATYCHGTKKRAANHLRGRGKISHTQTTWEQGDESVGGVSGQQNITLRPCTFLAI